MKPKLRLRHLILLVLCAMYFIAYIDRVNVAVAGPLIRKELGLTPTQLGFVFSAFEALRLKGEGKVRFLGVSGTLPNLVEQIDMGVFDAFQIPYSALQRDHEDVIALAAHAGAGVIVRGGVARGAPTDWQRTNYMVPSATMKDRWDGARLDDLLDGSTRIEFTLRFTLSHPGLSTTIVGTRNLEHLRDNIRAAQKGPLGADVLAEAKRRLAEAGSVPEPVTVPARTGSETSSAATPQSVAR